MGTAGNQAAGDSELWVEGDVVFVCRVGETTVEKAQALIDTVWETKLRHGRVYVVFDLTRMAAFPMEARKVMAESTRKNPPTAVACFGAGFTLRTITTLFAKAMQMAGVSMAFGSFRTEQQARTWIDAQKRQ